MKITVTPHTFATGVRLNLTPDVLAEALCALALDSTDPEWDAWWENLREAVEFRRLAESADWRDLGPESPNCYLDRAFIAVDNALRPLMDLPLPLSVDLSASEARDLAVQLGAMLAVSAA